MSKSVKSQKESPIRFIAILISIISIIFFIYLPFQIDLFPKNEVKKIHYVDNISDAHLKIIKKFNEIYKDEIEVVPKNLPFTYFTTNDRKAVLTRSLRNMSDGIDIFAVDLIWIKRFAKWGYPLEEYYDELVLSKVVDQALAACYQDNHLVAFPLFLDLTVLYYRKDLIEKLPDGKSIINKIQNSLTWTEFIELGKRFGNRNKPFYLFPGGNFEGMQCCFHGLISEEDANLFYKNPIDLNTPPIKKALNQLVDFVHKYNYSPIEVTKLDDFRSYLSANQEDAIFLHGWSGYHKQYKSFIKDSLKAKNMEIAPLPHFKGNETSGVFGGWSLMVSKFSTRKDEAIKFINFMFQKENQEILYNEGGYVPINKEVYEDDLIVNKNKDLSKIQGLLKWGKHRPFLDNYTRISEIIAKNFHEALKKEISVEEALKISTAQINNKKATTK